MNNSNSTSFMSVLLLIFTSVVAVSVLFSMASSASLLGQVIAFILAMIAFLFFIGMATYHLTKDR